MDAIDLPSDPFGRPTGLPATFDRSHRVALLAEAFEALAAGRLPSDEARAFTAYGGLAWLAQGGSLERDYWRVTAPRGSHMTPASVLRAHRDERQAAESSAECSNDTSTE